MYSFRDEEKTLVSRFLKCSDMEGSPKVRLNAVWKIILKEFRAYVCQDAEARLEKWIGKNHFFDQITCDMMKIDSPCYDMPTHPVELFTSKFTNKELMVG